MVTRADGSVEPSPRAILFYLYCEDVVGYRAELQESGVEVGEIEYPFYCPRGEFRVTDPDGYEIMVTHT